MQKRKKRAFVIAVLVVVLGIGWWYLFLGSRITDESSEIIAGENGTRSLVAYFSRTGEIPNTVDAVASATPNSNQAMDGSDTEAAAKMIQELTGADLYQIRTDRYYRSAFWGTAATAWIEETLNLRPGLAAQPEESALGYTTEGTERYRGFVIDNVFHSATEGDIHYNVYIPESYDGSEPHALYFTLPGYEGLYFQGVAANIQSEEFGFEAQKYNEKMIIVAPQLGDWGETSANQTIALVLDVKEHEYFTDRGMSNEHGGGGLFAYDEEIMGWLFSH